MSKIETRLLAELLDIFDANGTVAGSQPCSRGKSENYRKRSPATATPCRHQQSCLSVWQPPLSAAGIPPGRATETTVATGRKWFGLAAQSWSQRTLIKQPGRSPVSLPQLTWTVCQLPARPWKRRQTTFFRARILPGEEESLPGYFAGLDADASWVVAAKSTGTEVDVRAADRTIWSANLSRWGFC